MSAIDPGIMRIGRAVARQQAARGAMAVVLTGSHARSEANALSDIDIVVLVRHKPADDLPSEMMRGGRLMVLTHTTDRAVRAAFRDPSRIGTYVPGWREAIILYDEAGVAARLQTEARRWTWEGVADAVDEYVADEITGWAEEVLKLRAAIDDGRWLHAATQRSLLALQLAGLMALRRRILVGTENVQWDLVAKEMGEPWTSAQSRALSLSGETVTESCAAALGLYAIAAREAWPLLNRRQRAIVEHATGEDVGTWR